MIEVPEDFDLIQFLQSLEAYYRSTKEVPNTVDQSASSNVMIRLSILKKQKWRAIRVGNNVSSVLLNKKRGFSYKLKTSLFLCNSYITVR